MNETEMLEIIRDPCRLDQLADRFRRSRDVGRLLALLDAENEEIVSIGTWIAGEVDVDPATAGPLIVRLHELVNHRNPAIRFSVIGALFPFLDKTSTEAKEMLGRLSNDPDEGVRIAAKSALAPINEPTSQP